VGRTSAADPDVPTAHEPEPASAGRDAGAVRGDDGRRVAGGVGVALRAGDRASHGPSDRRDLRLAPTSHAPWGAIVWPADTDKRGREWEAPLNQPARDALDAWLAHDEAGDDWLFPHPDDIGRPIDKDVASGWLRRAESIARLPKLDRGVWHPYRRLWASERRHLSPIDVAAAGGWGDTRTLERSYQHADARGVLRATLNDDDE
jgi:integrase